MAVRIKYYHTIRYICATLQRVGNNDASRLISDTILLFLCFLAFSIFDYAKVVSPFMAIYVYIFTPPLRSAARLGKVTMPPRHHFTESRSEAVSFISASSVDAARIFDFTDDGIYCFR